MLVKARLYLQILVSLQEEEVAQKHRLTERRRSYDHGGRDWRHVTLSQSVDNHPKLVKGKNIFFPELSEGAWLCQYLHFGFLASWIL